MPIMSYLAYPVAGRYRDLVSELATLPECQLHEPETDAEILVVVTDTPDPAAEKELRARLEAIESLQCLAMVFGHREVEGEEGTP